MGRYQEHYDIKNLSEYELLQCSDYDSIFELLNSYGSIASKFTKERRSKGISDFHKSKEEKVYWDVFDNLKKKAKDRFKNLNIKKYDKNHNEIKFDFDSDINDIMKRYDSGDYLELKINNTYYKPSKVPLKKDVFGLGEGNSLNDDEKRDKFRRVGED